MRNYPCSRKCTEQCCMSPNCRKRPRSSRDVQERWIRPMYTVQRWSWDKTTNLRCLSTENPNEPVPDSYKCQSLSVSQHISLVNLQQQYRSYRTHSRGGPRDVGASKFSGRRTFFVSFGRSACEEEEKAVFIWSNRRMSASGIRKIQSIFFCINSIKRAFSTFHILDKHNRLFGFLYNIADYLSWASNDDLQTKCEALE